MILIGDFADTCGVWRSGLLVIFVSCLLQAMFHGSIVSRAAGTDIHYGPTSKDLIIDIWRESSLYDYELNKVLQNNR